MDELETKLSNQIISEDTGISTQTGSESVNFETTEDNASETESTTKEATEDDKEERTVKVAQKGVSITRALIMFGFESWSALEPGNCCNSLFFSLIIYTEYIFLF